MPKALQICLESSLPPFHGGSASQISLRPDSVRRETWNFKPPRNPKPRSLQRDPTWAHEPTFRVSEAPAASGWTLSLPLSGQPHLKLFILAPCILAKGVFCRPFLSVCQEQQLQGAFQSLACKRSRETFSREEPGCILC